MVSECVNITGVAACLSLYMTDANKWKQDGKTTHDKQWIARTSDLHKHTARVTESSCTVDTCDTHLR